MTDQHNFEDMLRVLHEAEGRISGAIAAYPNTPELPYSREALLELKSVIDRIRPLLWIYLNQAAEAGNGTKSAVEDCMEMTSKVMGPHRSPKHS